MAGFAAAGLANVDALFLGAVGAGAVGAGAVGGVVKLANKVNRVFQRTGKGIKRKFSQMSSGYATDTQMGGGGFAGATNVVQRAFTKSRIGRRMRKNVKNAHRLLQASMAYCNLRWQRMFSYGSQHDSTGPVNEQAYPSQTINLNTAGGGAQQGRLFFSNWAFGNPETGGQFTYMPCYLFDLTTWRTEQGFRSQSEPMKRLGFDNNGNVRWETVFSQESDTSAKTDGQWKLELVRGQTYAPYGVQKSFLMWSDIRLALYGAKKAPTRFIIEMIQFKKDYFAPNDATVLSSDQQAEVNAHYVSEMKKLVFHPQDVELNKRNSNIRVLYRKTYDIAPDTTVNADGDAPNVLVKIFKNFNRLCNWQWAINNAGAGVAEPDQVQPNFGEMQQPDWIQNGSGDIQQYVNRKARVYLYLRAEAMNEYGNILMNSAQALDYWPSFDVCVRQRWMYEN